MHYKSFKGVKNKRETPPSGSQLYSSVSLSTESREDDIEANSKSQARRQFIGEGITVHLLDSLSSPLLSENRTQDADIESSVTTTLYGQDSGCQSTQKSLKSERLQSSKRELFDNHRSKSLS